jgi:hypothetical protein
MHEVKGHFLKPIPFGYGTKEILQIQTDTFSVLLYVNVCFGNYYYVPVLAVGFWASLTCEVLGSNFL